VIRVTPMTLQRPLTASLCAATLLLASPARAALPRSSDERITLGEAKLAAGDRAGGVADLLQAYTELSDPLAHRATRGNLVGALRSELLELHADTDDPAYLCQLRALLITHVEALLVALGPTAGPPAIVGSQTRLHEAGELLRTRHPRTRCACDAWRPGQRPTPLLGADDPIRISPPTPTPSRPLLRETPRASPRLVAGSIVTGMGVGLAALLAVTLGANTRHHAAIRRAIVDGSAGLSIDEDALHRHVQVARWTRDASIGLGLAAAVTLAAGLGLLITHRQARRSEARLHIGPRAATLTWTVAF
jgi:hypothetical protein